MEECGLFEKRGMRERGEWGKRWWREKEKGRARVLVKKKKKQKRGETNESGVIMKKREWEDESY